MIEFFLGFRHIVERKFQSIFSILGVTIAITVFIVSLTISNGLEKNMVSSLLTLSPEISIKNREDIRLENYKEIVEKIKKLKNIKSVIPEINTQGIIKGDKFSKGVLAKGISYENVKDDLKLKMVNGNSDIEELNSILLGEELAKEMDIKQGDEISFISDENKEIRLFVKGIFKTGFLQYDSNLIIMPLETMQILFDSGEIVTEIGIKTENIRNIENTILEINGILSQEEYLITSWKDINQALLSAVKFEKFVLISILSLLLVIASFAVSVILNMIVREKTKDIGILKSVGYSNNNIKKIFIIEGMIIGILGIILASFISPLILILLKKIFEIYIKNSYYLEELPLYISIQELSMIYLISILVIFISTVYPAVRASKLNPVEALKYE